MHLKRQTAIARSKPEPCFLILAGERFIVYLIGGSVNPLFFIATRTLCEAASRSGSDICFEGVETGDLYDYLKSYGNVLLQGYLFDRPLTAEDLERKYGGKEAG